MLQPWFFTVEEMEEWQERSAIMEYDGGLSRAEADASAYETMMRREDEEEYYR